MAFFCIAERISQPQTPSLSKEKNLIKQRKLYPHLIGIAIYEVIPIRAKLLCHVLHLGVQTRSEEQNPIFELCPEWGVSQYYISGSIL